MHAGSATGVVSAGTVLAGVAPASAFALVVNGHAVERHVALGGAAVFSTPAGRAALVLRNLPLNAALALVTLGMWGMLLLGFGGLERVRRRVRGSRDNERPSPRRVDGAPS